MSFWQKLPSTYFILAPMEAVTDVVFRSVVERASPPDLYFTEFTNATGWTHAGEQAIGGRLIRSNNETNVVAQIWGGNPDDMKKLAEHCKNLGFIGIDINMGCPAKSAIKSGGSALVRNPALAVASIKAAKTAGLPVSVKTRLGYSSVTEWRNWLTTLLQEDIENLTIHLRSKKEMSKVPAHFELIPDIIALRDEIAPHTLITINGDIGSRAHGLELIRQYPGVNGIMIGRGIFKDPFCFSESTVDPDNYSYKGFKEESWPDKYSHPAPKERLFDLLLFHLAQYDRYSSQTKRPYETLKRFYKIYIRDFNGASELRDKLMHTKTTNEVRELIEQYR